VISYRSEVFARLKPRNRENILEAAKLGRVDVRFNTIVELIDNENVYIQDSKNLEKWKLKNDLVYIFAGGELPTEFLKKIGISITRKFGEAILKHH